MWRQNRYKETIDRKFGGKVDRYGVTSRQMGRHTETDTTVDRYK